MAENPDPSRTTPLYEAIHKLADQCDLVAEIARDPFKAPEEIMQHTAALLSVIWDAQVEFTAMRRYGSSNRD